MIKSISYWSMKDGLTNTHPIVNALTEAKQAGFEGLELCIGPEGVVNTSMTKSDCGSIRQQIEESGLVVETLASGISWRFNPTSEDATIRQKAIDLNAAALQRAAWLGCSDVLFVPGVVKSPIAPKEAIRYDIAVERVGNAVGQLLDTAECVGVNLCLENVWNGLFYSPLEFAAFVDEFNSQHLGIYYDCGNLLGYQQHPPHWIELLGQRIRRVHIKDYKEKFGWNGSYSFCDLGEGDVPWAETIAALRTIGYNQTIVAEMMPWREDLLSKTSEAMDHILAL